MASSITLSSVTTKANGSVVVEFSDGSGLEFSSTADLDNYVNEPVLDQQMVEPMKRMLLGLRKKKGDLSAVGKAMTFDLGQNNNIVRVS